MTPGIPPNLDQHFKEPSLITYSTINDPTIWAPDPGSGSITIPRWLGGAWTASYIVRHKWTCSLLLMFIRCGKRS